MVNIVLMIVLIISFITDMKDRKILNIITFPTMLFGIVFHSSLLGWNGFLFSFLGLLTGLGLLLIPYALGGMAAGDVKLLMAIGALKGTLFTLGSFLYTAIIGGIIALFILLSQKQLKNTVKRIVITARLKTLDGLSRNDYHEAFPYGVAIVFGTAVYMGVRLL